MDEITKHLINRVQHLRRNSVLGFENYRLIRARKFGREYQPVAAGFAFDGRGIKSTLPSLMSDSERAKKGAKKRWGGSSRNIIRTSRRY